MNEAVYSKVEYTVQMLMDNIALGSIGLPNIQRPFVWKNAKVRDLFDSMYRGYPVGYLLFWENALAADPKRRIGSDPKQKAPSLVIVDGQQRLTSLYAVIKNVAVLRKNYKSEHICIAFSPLTDHFAVADAAIRRDKSYLPDISRLWYTHASLLSLVGDYLSQVSSTRELSGADRQRAENAIMRLHGLTHYSFTTLQLSPNISDEDVSEIFVRINSEGTALVQSDFILTLMSVFWDEGRTQLETFCRRAHKPSDDGPSPYNHFIRPKPDQLLRVSVGLAFRRARLQYVYSILRGKDLETEQFSEERRIAQFQRLEVAQKHVLNLQYWHDFMSCLRQAGFRSQKMISSQSGLVYAYLLYLLGRTEYAVPKSRLRQAIARWFFMSSLTGRYTGSPESAMEFDLARFRRVADAEGFVRVLNEVCDTTLTSDYWRVSLPNMLATSSSRSPSLFAFQAAQVVLGATVLFSKDSVSDILDPVLHAPRSAGERHHLFPKSYLKGLGISGTRDTNQIANYTLVAWGDNAKIADQAPADYYPVMQARVKPAEMARMVHWHALPEGWEHLEYWEFLRQRREMMAEVIREAFAALSEGHGPAPGVGSEIDLDSIVSNGEHGRVEFKSTLRVNLHTGKPDARIEMAVLKTIAGFLNTSGGTLFVGVADDGSPLGLKNDGFPNEDKMSLHLVNIVKSRLGSLAMTVTHPRFEDLRGERVLTVQCKRSLQPVYVKDGAIERFFVRTGPSTTELPASQIPTYIEGHFNA